MTVTATDDGPGEKLARVDDLAGDTRTVATWTLVSRTTGFARVAVAAAVFGPTFFGNIFQATSLLPAYIYMFTAGTLVSAIVVPPLVKHLDLGNRKAASHLAGGFLGVALVALTAATAMVALAGPLVVRLLTLGVDDPATLDDSRRVAWVLFVILLPQVILLGTVGIAVAVQNASGRFALPAAAPVAENVGVITTLLVTAVMFGTGVGVEEATTAHLLVLGVGLTLSVIVHAGIQWWGAHRCGVTVIPRRGWRDREVRKLVRLSVPAIGTTALTTSMLLAITVVAGTVPGGVVAMQMALNFYNLPMALTGRPVGTAALPRLSRVWNERRLDGFREHYLEAFFLSAFFAFPASFALVALHDTLARAFAFGEMADGQGIRMIAVSLLAVSFGAAASSLFEIAQQAAYGMRDPRTPLLATVIRVLFGAVGLGIAFVITDDLWTLAAIGASVSLGDIASTLFLHRRVSSALPAAPRGTFRPLWLSIAAGIAMAPPTWLVARVVAGASGSRLADLAAVGFAGLVGLVVYVALQAKLGSQELRNLASPVLDRIERLRPNHGTPAGGDRSDIERPVGHPRFPRRLIETVAMTGLAFIVAVAAGAAAALGGVLAVAGAAGLALAVVVMARPHLAGYIALGTLPVLAGMTRGEWIPLIRPSEAMYGLLMGAVLARFLLRLLGGYRPRLVLSRIDAAILAMAVSSSVVPILWMFLRGLQPTLADLLSTIVLWKYYGVYLLIRASARDDRDLQGYLMTSVVAASGITVVVLAQQFGVGPVNDLLARFWIPETETHTLDLGRATTTFASAIATSVYLGFNLAAALSLALKGVGRTRLSWVISGVLVVGLLGTGQFTAPIGLGVMALAIAYVTGRARFLLVRSAPALPLALLLTWPVLQTRISGFSSPQGLPQSWLGRIDNLTNFYLPALGGNRWLLGVRPDAVLMAPETWRDIIYLESGYLWLLWVGGLPFLAAFLVFGKVALRWCSTRARAISGAQGAAAVAAYGVLAAVLVMSVFDPHLTMRGGADMLFILLACTSGPNLGRVLQSKHADHPPLFQHDGTPISITHQGGTRWAV